MAAKVAQCACLSSSLPVSSSSAEGIGISAALITRAKLAAPKGESTLTLDDLDGAPAALSRCVGREALNAARHGVGGLVDRVARLFGRGRSGWSCSVTCTTRMPATIQSLLDLAAAFRVPVMASNGVRFADRRIAAAVRRAHVHPPEDRRSSGGPAACRQRRAVSEAAATRWRGCSPICRRRWPAREALAERLEFTLANLGYRFPEYPVPAGETQASFLRQLAQVGARDRYRPYHDRARAQIARELDLIEKLDLAGYFLIVWDIVNFCRQQGHPRAGPRIGGQQRRLLRAGHHGRRSGRDGSAVRAVSLGRARRVARHRSRSAERRSARARDSVRLPSATAAHRRRHDRERHHVSRPQRRARSGQGARLRARRRSIGWPR